MSLTNEKTTLSTGPLQLGKTRHAPPRASAMLESLRGLGYSTGAALADVIDNSISAGANTINIQFNWDGQSSNIYVLDNGSGMSDEELESAMTLGDKNPLDVRSTHDLGRFGMGLKTASLSQCKRLTVASKKGGSINCLRWDLEVLASNPDIGWVLIEGPALARQAIFFTDARHFRDRGGQAQGHCSQQRTTPQRNARGAHHRRDLPRL